MPSWMMLERLDADQWFQRFQLSRDRGGRRNQEFKRPLPFPDQGGSGRSGNAAVYGARRGAYRAGARDRHGPCQGMDAGVSGHTCIPRNRRCPCTVSPAAPPPRDLPPQVAIEVQRFFRMCLDKLIAAGLSPDGAAKLLATITGAMVVANALGDMDAYDRATAELDAGAGVMIATELISATAALTCRRMSVRHVPLHAGARRRGRGPGCRRRAA